MGTYLMLKSKAHLYFFDDPLPELIADRYRVE